MCHYRSLPPPLPPPRAKEEEEEEELGPLLCKGGHRPEFLLSGLAGLFHFMYGPSRASPRAKIVRAKI